MSWSGHSHPAQPEDHEEAPDDGEHQAEAPESLQQAQG